MNDNNRIKALILKVIDTLLKLLTIGTIIFIVSCEESLGDEYESFLIPKGQHKVAIPKMQALQSRTLAFKALFDNSAIYETNMVENQHDINKLMGFADCNAHHHDNSARFGWRWLDGKLQIHAYVYNNGIRTSSYIGDVSLNKSYIYDLSFNDEFYIFSLEGSEPIYMTRTKSCNRGIYYMLFPYFGGDETAPHDIFISIEQTSF
ncbi:MAG: hypothetical protein AB8B73_12840 [Ekhidna sp.]